jgi:hypothetical protein
MTTGITRFLAIVSTFRARTPRAFSLGTPRAIEY